MYQIPPEQTSCLNAWEYFSDRLNEVSYCDSAKTDETQGIVHKDKGLWSCDIRKTQEAWVYW